MKFQFEKDKKMMQLQKDFGSIVMQKKLEKERVGGKLVS